MNEWDKCMEEFDWVLKDKFNTQSMENTKVIAKKYLTNVLDLDLEDSTLNDDSNGIIEK